MTDYDSTQDTYNHINMVRVHLQHVTYDLRERGSNHDASKLDDPEKPIFDEFTPKLKDTTYGSDEYKGYLKEMGVALDHHYKVNDHHSEHFRGGIHDMNLIQLIEMLADWKAATMRVEDGNLHKSIFQNAERFHYDNAMRDLLIRTAEYLGWL